MYVCNVKRVSSEYTNKDIDRLTHHKNSIINLNYLQLFAYGMIILITESTKFLPQSDFSVMIKGQEADHWIKYWFSEGHNTFAEFTEIHKVGSWTKVESKVQKNVLNMIYCKCTHMKTIVSFIYENVHIRFIAI